ncbi:MAG: DNA translocase FtsK, partial [Anaerolineae bacterium]
SGGAEKLLGRGDMLFMAPDSSQLVRLQGCFVSDREMEELVRFWRGTGFAPKVTTERMIQQPLWEDLRAKEARRRDRDDLFDEAVKVVQRHDRASISLLQRKLHIGYTRAARLIDLMEEEGVVSPAEDGARWRKVLVKEKEIFKQEVEPAPSLEQ